ncbi:MAG: biotin transporter BioY [Chloroflexaceae bacterium]|nr:biotin transporter BioY [Chloroflexaceae bacterium]NJL34288.1 biotin transporter BioY [Chloroflexaceae bacterium]NJO04587.1 biotin transporter BioY [Chloroflexaceae bacterium]
MSIIGTPSTDTLAQRLLPRERWLANVHVRNAVLVVAGALFVALTAQIRIPLPFTPVPITGQTLGVLLVGGLLGSRLGGGSLLFYLLLGLIGLPVYTGGSSGIEIWQGATAGYLASFPIAAALMGWLAERGWDRSIWKTALGMVLGNVVIYTLGAGWLAFGLGMGVATAFTAGVLPFLIGDAIKIVLAAVALPGGWRLLK